jgi:hypothetical protein
MLVTQRVSIGMSLHKSPNCRLAGTRLECSLTAIHVQQLKETLHYAASASGIMLSCLRQC